ncbi:MAG: tRNA lysidine(34) synthetase TilS [Candidatus Cloacimonetes bacterium]|nr:tRNA lysidine(34) synthetase TilS [Candidatus Cloacimonadota bacterium]
MSKNRDLLNNFRDYFTRHDLIQRHDKLLVAVSGGIDSTVLLHLLKRIKSEYGFILLGVHINYHLRGTESEKNYRFVSRLCHGWGVPLVVQNVEIKSGNIENEARKIRYKIFQDLLEKYNFDKVVVGHNKNDQAETLMLNLIRGAGIAGMKGMFPKTNSLVRPLLNFTRNEIEEYVEMKGLKYAQDSSNFNLEYDRNKIRLKILPLIEELLNPRAVEKIADSMHILQETEYFLQHYSADLFSELITKESKDSYSVQIDDLKHKGIVLFYLFKKIFAALTGTEKDFYSYHYQEIKDLLGSSGSKYIQLPDYVYAIKGKNKLTFANSPPALWQNKTVKTIDDISRRVVFLNNYITTSKIKTMPVGSFDFSDRWTCYLDFDKVEFPLKVRTRRKGDKFVPFGMEQEKKLKDFFIDEKVPRYKRDEVIIIEDQKRIIWVAGYRINHRVRITRQTKMALSIKIIKKISHPRRARRLENKS